MTFNLTWAMEAFVQLNAIISKTDMPDRINRASDMIDYILRRFPLDVGESRDEGFRLWYGDVLAVYYSVDDAQNRVRVLAVGLSKRLK